LLLFTVTHAKDIKPIATLQTSGLVSDSGISGYRNVWIHDEKKPIYKKLTQIIDEKKHLMPKRAFFSSTGKVVLVMGHHATPTKVMFSTEKTLISAGDEYTIYFWRLDK